MRGNGKVFISHAHDDNARCAPLLAALDAWGVDYWFDTQRLEAGHDLSRAIQREIAERDIFLRICTPAAQKSYWVQLETGAFRGLQAREAREEGGSGEGRRVLLNLILDASYQPEPFDYAHRFIDATSTPQRAWLEELRRGLGVGAPTPAMPIPPASTSTSPASHAVSAMGGADFASIAAALRTARPGDTIFVLPGRYAEELVVEQSVTLLGKGAREAIVIEGRAAPVLRCTAGSLRVENLTLRQGGGKNLDCVAVMGGSCTLIDCDVSAETAGACVNLGSGEDALLRGNVIHDGGGWGVFIGGTGVVTLEENEIMAHAYSGVTVMRDGYVLARRNRITRNAQHAVRLYAGGGGAFEDNDLRGNYLATWNIEPGSYGKLLRERNKG